MSVKNVRNLLKSYGIRPRKRFGQNFLISENAFDAIIKAADLSKKDTVMEIGPGIGNLTMRLAEESKEVIAVEKDKKMCEILVQVLKDNNIDNVKIINKDILKLNLAPYTENPYKLVANLPYYITSPVIRKFLEAKQRPKMMILMVQKEVAQRICAKPPKLSILGVSVQFHAEPEIISYVSKKAFWPQPKVDSATIKIVPRRTRIPPEFEKRFFDIIKAGFSQPRKQIANNLSKKMSLGKEKTERWLLKNEIKPSQRAETLSLDDWKRLVKNYIIDK